MRARTSVLAVIRLVASIPSMTGIRTSMRMTSGLARRAASTASAPLPASPTTANPGVAAMMPAEAHPDQGLIVGHDHPQGHAGLLTSRGQREVLADLEAVPGQRPGAELPAEQAHPLAHADDAVPGPADGVLEAVVRGDVPREGHRGQPAVAVTSSTSSSRP